MFLVVLASCGGGSDQPSSPATTITVDAFEFSTPTTTYCCQTTPADGWFSTNFFNVGQSKGEPSNVRGAPDGAYAVLSNGYSLFPVEAFSKVKLHVSPANTGVYELWSGSTIPSTVCSSGHLDTTCNVGVLAGSPATYGFSLLGSGSTTQEFSGAGAYLLLRARP